MGERVFVVRDGYYEECMYSFTTRIRKRMYLSMIPSLFYSCLRNYKEKMITFKENNLNKYVCKVDKNQISICNIMDIAL